MAGVVIEGMGVLWAKTDSPGVVVVVWMSLVLGKWEVMERLGREMDLTSRFLDVENRADEVVAMVDEPASGGLAHIGFMFLHLENGGYMSLEWLGELQSVWEPYVEFWQGGEQWAEQWLYRDGYGRNRCALESFFEAQEGLVVVVIICCRRPDLHPALFINISHPSACSYHALLPHHPSSRSS
ncbi:hypothetical protein ARMSODRAFT_977486 [Armillaria solidipes]|uniref:Uncharacterized protein n=1 Tax=Armillaria solidipes TaxID=1076256 RepID=A0A2H3BA75_9AGAR|nr:hypothetical protein ARMSODRAFT_977486 [Armillaria solidipes]